MQGDQKRSWILMGVAALALGITMFFSPKKATPPKQTASAHAAAQPTLPSNEKTDTTVLSPRSKEVMVTLENEKVKAVISTHSGGFLTYELKDPSYRVNKKPIDLVSTNDDMYAPLRLDLGSKETWDYRVVSQNKNQVVLRATHPHHQEMTIHRTYGLSDGYKWTFETRIENSGMRAKRVWPKLSVHHYVKQKDESNGMFSSPSWKVVHGMCATMEETERKDKDKLLTPHGYQKPEIVSLENGYFAQAIAHAADKSNPPKPELAAQERCGLSTEPRGGKVGSPEGHLFHGWLSYGEQTIRPNGTLTMVHEGWMGPKEQDALKAAGPEFYKVVDLGWFSSIAEFLSSLLKTISGWTGNWGIAIILLTLLIRVLLWPLTESGFKSSVQMRALKPEMDEIHAKYGNDWEKKQAAQAELYKRHGINPLSQMKGCLPALLQMPIWFALYRALSNNTDLFHKPFMLWWTDLSAPDPYFVLPLLWGALMHVQQRLMPTSMDPQQAKMMMWMMPGMMTVFSLFMPSGLSLYWVAGAVITLIQQQVNEYRIRKIQQKAAAT